MKQFATAARRGKAAVANAVPISFEFEVSDGEFIEMTAHPPTTGQMALFLAERGHGATRAVQAMFQFLADVLDEMDYELIEQKLRDGIDVGVIVDIIEYLTEEWAARPTMPSPSSSASRRSTGRRSTAKRPAKGSTTST